MVVPYEEIDPWCVTANSRWHVALHFLASLHGAVHDVTNNGMLATEGQYHFARAAIRSPIPVEGVFTLCVPQFVENLVQVSFNFRFGHGVRVQALELCSSIFLYSLASTFKKASVKHRNSASAVLHQRLWMKLPRSITTVWCHEEVVQRALKNVVCCGIASIIDVLATASDSNGSRLIVDVVVWRII